MGEPAGTSPTVYLCTGSDCQDRKAYRALRDVLSSYGPITEVGCQKICQGPVCGVSVQGRLEWFADISTDKSRAGLELLLSGAALAKALKNRQVKKHSGRLR